jgi:hypothetical protein
MLIQDGHTRCYVQQQQGVAQHVLNPKLLQRSC